jgi:hypothetical protein
MKEGFEMKVKVSYIGRVEKEIEIDDEFAPTTLHDCYDEKLWKNMYNEVYQKLNKVTDCDEILDIEIPNLEHYIELERDV